jgi:hypothetical protein
METLEALEAALTRAEAELARAVAERYSNPDATEAESEIERARDHCRRAQAALAQLKHPEATPHTLMPNENAAAEKPDRQSRPQKGANANKLMRALARRLAPTLSAPDWSLLLRQAVMLLALVLAYLQYYFLDVRLQVTTLPSLFG